MRVLRAVTPAEEVTCESCGSREPLGELVVVATGDEDGALEEWWCRGCVEEEDGGLVQLAGIAPSTPPLPAGWQGCEWEPGASRPALEDDSHWRQAAATVVVGAKSQWRLCAACAAEPRFGSYRQQRPLDKRDRPRRPRG